MNVEKVYTIGISIDEEKNEAYAVVSEMSDDHKMKIINCFGGNNAVELYNLLSNPIKKDAE